MSRFTNGASWSKVAAIAILALAAVLRLLWIDAGWFGVDQARDLAWAEAIATGQEFPLIGPLMRGRLHLGATYYYFWSIPLWFSRDPLAAYRFAAVLGVLAVWAVYRLGTRLGGKGVGLAAAVIFATMPTAVIHARVAWAPAALPPLVATLLLTAHRFLERPTASRAALVLGLASLGTQLHLAAVPLAGFVGILVLSRVAALGRRGTALALLAGIVPLLPMALALRFAGGPGEGMVGDTRSATMSQSPTALSTVSVPRAPDDLRAHRMADVLTSGGRAIDALTAPTGDRPRLVDAWATLERWMMPLTLLAAVLCLRAGKSEGRRPRPLATRGLLVTIPIGLSVLAVVLPTEAWWYYLDPILVPAALALAIVARPDRLRVGALAVAALALVRTIGLLWWIGANHVGGFVLANLDLLRLGGPDAPAAAGRARLPTVKVKEGAADALVGGLGIPLAALWSRAHGSGFADLDTDNGFYFRRAAARSSTTSNAGGRAEERSSDALVVYAHDLPTGWTERFPPPVRIGPLALYRYTPTLRAADAVIVNCGGAVPPERLALDPRDYFFGQPRYPAWPCADPVIQVPVAAAPEGTSVRVFARLAGAGRVTTISAEPAGEPIVDDVPGAGSGLLLAPGHATVRVALALAGPAALDLYELHGAAGAHP